MLIGIPRHLMIKTICKNYVRAKIIEPDEVDYTSQLLATYSDKELVEALLDAHMLIPLNLEQHEVGFISEN